MNLAKFIGFMSKPGVSSALNTVTSIIMMFMFARDED